MTTELKLSAARLAELLERVETDIALTTRSEPPHPNDATVVCTDDLRALLDRIGDQDRRLDEALGIERCGACGETLNDGDLVLNDESLDGIHAACCGPERESYTLDGAPLGPDDPIPAGYSYERDTAERRIANVIAARDALKSQLAEAREALALQQPSGGWREPKVFLDCDGVLADFDAHGLAYFGKSPRQAEAELGSKEFWRQLEAQGDFYRTMPVMAGARELYEGVKHLHPTILTGCPKGNWAQGQKVAWAAEHFPGVPIITCRSADKRDYAKPGDVLIDDWPQHRHRWIEMGGHFVLHLDAASSLAALWAHCPQLLPAPPTHPTEDCKWPVCPGHEAGACFGCTANGGDPNSWGKRPTEEES